MKSWLQRNLDGEAGSIEIAIGLVLAIQQECTLEGTAFEEVFQLVNHLYVQAKACTSEDQFFAAYEAHGKPLLSALEEITAGGLCLELARNVLAQMHRPADESTPAPADDADAFEDDAALDQLFAESAPEELVAAPLAATTPAEPAAAGAPEAETEAEPEADFEMGFAAEPVALHSAIDALSTIIEPPTEPMKNDVPDVPLTKEPVAPTPKVSEQPAAKSADEAMPEVPQPTAQERERQTVALLTLRMTELIDRLALPDTEAACSELHKLVDEINRPLRRLGYQTFSSLNSTVQQTLESVLEARVDVPAEVLERLRKYHGCLIDVLTEDVSQKKTYYQLVTELLDSHEFIKAAVEEREEERLNRSMAGAEQTEDEGGANASAVAPEETPDNGGSEPDEARQSKLTNLQEIFLVEAFEHIDAMIRNLLLIEKSPANPELIYALMRSAHSLKGSAAIAKYQEISVFAHAMEDLLTVFRDEALQMSTDAINLLLACVDQMQLMCNCAETGTRVAPEREAMLRQNLQQLTEVVQSHLDEFRAHPEQMEGQLQIDLPTAQTSGAESQEIVKYIRVDVAQLDTLMNLAADMVINRTRLMTQLERQQAQLHDLFTCRRQLKELSNQLGSALLDSRARGTMELVGSHAESSATMAYTVHGGHHGGGKTGFGSSYSDQGRQILDDFSEHEFDRYSQLDLIARDFRDALSQLNDLSDGLTQVTGGLEQNLSLVSLVANDLHQSLMRTRMVPVGQIFSRFPRVVRDLSQQLGKQIILNMTGEETLLDKSIIEEITDPLIHLVRNAVDHGIETTDERERMEKPPTGHIWLTARQAGNHVLLEIRDDGRGINLTAVRREALQRGFLNAEQAAAATDHDLLNVLLMPGFSTASEVTTLSGRGVGLDVANQAIKQLKGTLHISSEFGEGTTISIRLPITLAISQALLFRSGTETFAIALSAVDELISRSDAEIHRSGGRSILMLRGQAIPLVNFEELANLDADENETERLSQIIIISDGINRGGLLVDSLLGREEIVVKSMGNHLRKARFFSGATILGDGHVTLIVNPTHILASCETGTQGVVEEQEAIPAAISPSIRQREAETQTPASAGLPAAPAAQPRAQESVARSAAPVAQAPRPRGRRRILITDDSISIRRYVSGILEAAGYEVETACDGMDALQKLDQAGFDLILTDLEMPRMHGYELITEIRSGKQHRNVPIIILTSRMGDKHSRKGLELGASAYMCKPFEQAELLSNVERLTNAQAN
jgi:chemotaxis protein histidine kinase CheA/ActR/RegA family two-component response regulator